MNDQMKIKEEFRNDEIEIKEEFISDDNFTFNSEELMIKNKENKSHEKPCKMPQKSFIVTGNGFYNSSSNSTRKSRKPFKCIECDCKYSNKQDLTRHIHAVHEKLASFKCIECECKFSFKRDLNRHIDAVHRKLKPFECTECDYKCSQKYQLKQHNNAVHNNLKQFQCTE